MARYIMTVIWADIFKATQFDKKENLMLQVQVFL